MVVKTKAEARANFEAAVAYIPDRYRAGIEKADWFTKASSDQAEKNYATAVADAIAKKTRQKGVRSVTNEDWRTAAREKGAPIIGARISAALPDWEANWGPMYDQVVSKVGALPPKVVDFRANITARLVPVVEAWKKAAGKL